MKKYIIVALFTFMFSTIAFCAEIAPEPPKLSLPGQDEPSPKFSIPDTDQVKQAELLKSKLAELRRLQQQIQQEDDAERAEDAAHQALVRELERGIESRTKDLDAAAKELAAAKIRAVSLSQTVAQLNSETGAVNKVIEDALLAVQKDHTETLAFAEKPAAEEPSPANRSPADAVSAILRLHNDVVQDGNLVEPGKMEVSSNGVAQVVDAFRLGDLALFCLLENGETAIYGHPGRKEIQRTKDVGSRVHDALEVLRRREAPRITDLPIPPNLTENSIPLEEVKK